MSASFPDGDRDALEAEVDADDEGPSPTFEAGAAQRDITPEFEPYTDLNRNGVWDEDEPFEDLNDNGKLDTLWIGGFSLRQPTGVHDPLWVRAVAMRFEEEIYVFAAVDTVGLSMKRIEAMKQAAAQALAPNYSLDPTHCFIASTHTHQGPDTQGVSGPSMSPGWDEEYLQRIVAQGSAAIAESVRALRPATLTISHGHRPDLVRDIVSPEIKDDYIGILKLADRTDSSTIATMVTIANHPEGAWGDNTLISADYPYFLRRKLEEDLGGIALFFSADLGLMQTPVEDVEIGFEGKRCQAVGEAYAETIVEALADAQPLKENELQPVFGFAKITTPLQNFELFVAVKTDIAEGYRDYMVHTDTPPCNRWACLDIPAAVLKIGDKMTIISIPGELTPELLLGGIVQPPDYQGPYPDAQPEPIIKDHLATSERFVIGLCGASIGYIFPKMTFDPQAYFDQTHGAGEDVASHFLTGLNALLDHVNGL